MADLSKLSDADLQAITRGDMSAVSDEGLNVVAGNQPQEADIGEYAAQALQGATLGWGDELVGGAYGAYRSIKDDTPLWETMKRGAKAASLQQREGREKMGEGTGLALEIAGGIPTAFVGGAGALGAKGLTTLGKLGQAAKTGAKLGAVSGAGMAEGGLADRATGAAMGAGAGAVLSPALIGAGQVAKAGAGVLGRAVRGGAERQAKNLARSVIAPEDAARMEQELQSGVLKTEGVLADVAPENALRLAGASARRVGGGDEATALAQRHRGQYERLAPSVDELVSDKTMYETVEGLTQARRAAANKNYGALYDAPVSITDEMKSTFNTDTGREGWKLAQKLAADEGIELPELYKADGKLTTMVDPDMRTLDLWKRGMDAVVEQRFKESGTLGASAKAVRDGFRNHMDKLVPEYANVRSEYAGYSAAMDAANAGNKFMRATMLEGTEDAMDLSLKDIGKMGVHEAEAFRSGVASALRDQMGNKPFGADITKLFDKPNVHKKLAAVLGEDGKDKLLADVGLEAQMAKTYGELQGSQTAKNLLADKSMGNVGGLVQEGFAASMGSPYGYQALVTRAADAVNAPPESVAREFNKLMLSPNATDRAAAIALLKRGQSPLKPIGAASRGVLGVGGGYGGGSLQTPEESTYLLNPYGNK